MLTRRQFLHLSAVAGAAMLLPWEQARRVLAQAPLMLDPATQPQFVNPMPVIKAAGLRVDATGGGTLPIRMAPTIQNLGLVDPVAGTPLLTPVWGYGVGSTASDPVYYPGPTIVTKRDVELNVDWINHLGYSHDLPVDETLHWAFGHMGAYSIAANGIPAVPHLHGGHTESDSDGLPEYWWTPDGTEGPRFVKKLYTYANDQEAGTLWYHDHGLGITRLNVYMGLAGFYLLRDDWEQNLITTNKIPSGDREIEIVIQDRIFAADGSLLYPADPALAGLPPTFNGGISALPEFFGNVILVNGKAWPFLNVEPVKYRFRLLNGSDSRFYSLFMGTSAGLSVPFIQIGSDDGFLNAPVTLNQLTIGPGERADLVIDFTAFAGQQIIVKNNARVPFDKGGTVDPKLDGRIMAFNVAAAATTPDLVTLPAVLRQTPFPVVVEPPIRTRQLLLFEGLDKFGRLQPLLGTVDPTSVNDGTLLWDDPITEVPNRDDVEIWEVYNTTMDAHPIHLHLVTFEVLNRQKFTGTILPKANVDPKHPTDPPTQGGILTGIRLKGRPKAAGPEEAGPKDTAQMYPGEVTRIKVKFDGEGRYVWHCHILSHEDHEMMRPYYVSPYGSAFYPAGPAHWATNSVEGNTGFDPHWLQISMAAGAEPFMHGLSYYGAMTAGTNEWFQLARQYIAAKLNILAGVNGASITATLADAATILMNNDKVISAGDLAAAVATTNALASFNTP